MGMLCTIFAYVGVLFMSRGVYFTAACEVRGP